jgi:aspartate 1-decarboxylase
MKRTMCKSKIHGVLVTEANLNYMGSLTIDRDLMEAANIIPYEWLHVANVTTGSRFETYAISGEAGSGVIGLNGAAARLGQPGDKLIIMCSTVLDEDELQDFNPRLVFVDGQNRMVTPGHATESGMNEALRTSE